MIKHAPPAPQRALVIKQLSHPAAEISSSAESCGAFVLLPGLGEYGLADIWGSAYNVRWKTWVLNMQADAQGHLIPSVQRVSLVQLWGRSTAEMRDLQSHHHALIMPLSFWHASYIFVSPRAASLVWVAG